jgi:membrane protein DedA with SNARE-associated domain/rhodanese-related sulfurtransferase
MLHDLIARYGPWLVFANVLGASLGLPVPAMPSMILIGASIAVTQASPWQPLGQVLALAVCASLIGDTVWFFAGRHYGGATLKTLCKVSLARDSCVRQTERFFGRFGARVLSFAKFVPGLSLVSVPVAGAMGVSLRIFLAMDGLGALIWASVGLTLGVAFSNQLDSLFDTLRLFGRRAAICAVIFLAAYVAYRWWRRRALLRTLETARLSVDDLYKLMDADPPPLIVDIRSPEKRTLDPYIIPGACFIDERDLSQFASTVPHTRKVVIYCSCPNEVSAAWVAKSLRNLGFADATPLLGGLDAWRLAGWETAPLETVAELKLQPAPG